MIKYSAKFQVFLENSSCRIAQILYHAHIRQHLAYRYMLSTRLINYLDFTKFGGIRFRPASKPPVNTEDWEDALDGMQYGKAAKIIRKLFTKKAIRLFEDADFEDFANACKSASTHHYHFQLLPHHYIGDIYNRRIPDNESGLSTSCMNGHAEFMEIYDHFPGVSILILTNQVGRLYGRALVWHLPAYGMTFLDRMYVSEDFMHQMFLDYAKKKGWWRKKNYKKLTDKTTFIAPDGTEAEKHIRIELHTDYEEFPCIDTFSYGGNGYLNNYGLGPFLYTQLDGTRSVRLWDEIDECELGHLEGIMISKGIYAWRFTNMENTVDFDGDTWYKLDPEITELRDGFHYSRDTVWSYFSACAFLRKDCVWCQDLDSYILKEDAVEISGALYHRENIPSWTERASAFNE